MFCASTVRIVTDSQVLSNYCRTQYKKQRIKGKSYRFSKWKKFMIKGMQGSLPPGHTEHERYNTCGHFRIEFIMCLALVI